MSGLPYNHECKLCPLHLYAQSVCLPGSGSLSSEILILSGQSREDDDLLNLPEQGKHGRLLRAAIKEIGLENKVRIETVVRCRTPDNRDPTRLEMDTCLPYLEKIVTEEMPNLKWMVALGDIPIKVVGLKGPVKDLAGIPSYPVQVCGRDLTIYPMMHPAGVLRNPGYLSTWESHWHGLKKLVDQATMTNNSITLTSLEDVILDATENPLPVPIALDLETTDLDAKKGSILSWSVSSPSKTFGEYIDSPQKLKRLVNFTDIRDLSVHGAFFEGSWFKDNLGLSRQQLLDCISRDTMLMSHRVDPGQPADLGSVCARHVPEFSGYKVSTVGQIENAQDIPKDKLVERNCYDSRVTAIACERLEKAMPPGVTDELLREDVQLALTVEEIASKGLVMDEDTMIKLRADNEDKQKVTTQKCEGILGRSVNLGSSHQVGESLVSLGAEVGVSKDTGNFQTGEVELRIICEGSNNHLVRELVEHVLSYREAGKVLGTYLKGYAQRRDGDGRLRTRLRFPGTISWRLSSSDPNMQNVPRGVFRKVFVAPPGYTFMECDLAQAELRVMACLSNDPVLFPTFMMGGDPHNLMVQQIGKSNPAFFLLDPKEQRNRAKVTNFGLGYGAGPATLWEQFAKDGVFIPMAECRLYHKTFWGTYTGLAKFVENQMDIARNGGRLYAPAGGYSWTLRDLELLHPHDREEALRACFNSTIQSVPPRITLRLATRLLSLGLEVVLQTHDGLLLYVPVGMEKEIAIKVKEITKELTTESWTKGLPIPVDVKVGPSWGQLSDLKV